MLRLSRARSESWGRAMGEDSLPGSPFRRRGGPVRGQRRYEIDLQVLKTILDGKGTC